MSEPGVSPAPRRVLAGYEAGQFGKRAGVAAAWEGRLIGYRAGAFGAKAEASRHWRYVAARKDAEHFTKVALAEAKALVADV